MGNIIGAPEPWPGSTEADIQQNYVDTCAVKSQQIIMQTFGVDIPEDVLAIESAIKGYYMPGYGSDPNQVGQLLTDHGIPTHSQSNASVYDIVNELAQGHKVIVGVDADELWRPSIFNDLFGEEANHAIVVTGIDTSDPENVMVIVTDPGSGDVAKEYPIEQFIDAWHDSNCFFVATDNPVPEDRPEMIGFDFELGHIPYVADMPYDFYSPYMNETNIFHDSIIAHMNETLNNLNNMSEFEIEEARSGFHDAFDHMNGVNQLMNEAWINIEVNSQMYDFMSTHQSMVLDNLFNECWNWDSCQSELPDNLASFDIDPMA